MRTGEDTVDDREEINKRVINSENGIVPPMFMLSSTQSLCTHHQMSIICSNTSKPGMYVLSYRTYYF